MNELEKSQDETLCLLEKLKENNKISQGFYDDFKTIYTTPSIKHKVEEFIRSMNEESQRLYEEKVRKSIEAAKKKLG